MMDEMCKFQKKTALTDCQRGEREELGLMLKINLLSLSLSQV
jgi:hypothetical protein